MMGYKLGEVDRLSAEGPRPGWAVGVRAAPRCEVCARYGVDAPAIVAGMTRLRSWSPMCRDHYLRLGVGLGLGRGVVLIEGGVR